MSDLDEALRDGRFARVMLAIASEPGDTVTARLVRTLGAADTVRLGRTVGGDDASPFDLDAWRERVAPRLNVDAAQRTLEVTAEIGARVLTLGMRGGLCRWRC